MEINETRAKMRAAWTPERKTKMRALGLQRWSPVRRAEIKLAALKKQWETVILPKLKATGAHLGLTATDRDFIQAHEHKVRALEQEIEQLKALDYLNYSNYPDYQI